METMMAGNAIMYGRKFFEMIHQSIEEQQKLV